MTSLPRPLICATLLLLPACDMGHLGNPLTLPASGIATAVENRSYDRQRAQVKDWITRHEAAMRAEGFDGPVTETLLATVPKHNRAHVRRDLKDAAQQPNFPENATIIVMVHR